MRAVITIRVNWSLVGGRPFIHVVVVGHDHHRDGALRGEWERSVEEGTGEETEHLWVACGELRGGEREPPKRRALSGTTGEPLWTARPCSV